MLGAEQFTIRTGEPHRRVVGPEVASMYVEESLVVATAEEALCMKADGKEQWCISWLEWFWQQEIEGAVWSVKQCRS